MGNVVAAPHLALVEKAGKDAKAISPKSQELVIAVVGYAGSGSSTVAKRLRAELHGLGYEDPHIVKLSTLIEKKFPSGAVPAVEDSVHQGTQKLARAIELQNLGDSLRKKHGKFAVASLAVQEIIRLRAGVSPGTQKVAYIIDSIKHLEEVELLRRVYDKTFRLIAVHCERAEREVRLIGDLDSAAKYSGANELEIKKYLDRDEKDIQNKHGQQVRDAFHHADYFLDNNEKSSNAVRVSGDLKRFVKLILNKGLVRPTREEVGMFYAQAAALRSSCLSRQVGAALQAQDGTIVSTGANEVPAFGGGVCNEDHFPDNRCFAWKWKKDGGETHCHNTRLKDDLRGKIAKWLSESFADSLALALYPSKEGELDTSNLARERASGIIRNFFYSDPERLEEMPGVRDIIEYSRSIHAEMNALFSAAAQGISPVGCTLFTTTFPCHNCARHIVTAGVKEVYYIEPFTKSLATVLHEDSLTTLRDSKENKMKVLPFTGVGPRMYEDYFLKRMDLKDDRTGEYKGPSGSALEIAVRLRELSDVEETAAKLLSD